MWSFEAELNSLGFEFEPFGDGALRVCGVPETVTDAGVALEAALGALAGGEDLAKALACKGSTRFGESLGREEMETLLEEWAATEFKETCAPGWKNFRSSISRTANRKRCRASRVGEGLKRSSAPDLAHRVCRICKP